MDNQPNFEGEEMKNPTPTNNFNSPEDATAKTKGPFIILLFVALALILAGLFYWYKTASVIPPPIITPERPTAEMNKEPETTTATAQVDSFSAMSTSDELNALEADLESTNLDSLEAELLQIDAELNTATVQ